MHKGRTCPVQPRALEFVELLADGADDMSFNLNIEGCWYQLAMARVPGKPFAHMYRRRVEVHEARSRAAQAERHKSDFLSVMSHEIRTPLNGILGLIELMMRSEQSEEERRTHLVHGICRQPFEGVADRCARPRTLGQWKAEPHLTSFATRDFFKRVVNSFGKRAEATGNRLELAVEDAVPDALVADVGWVTQMMNN